LDQHSRVAQAVADSDWRKRDMRLAQAA